MATQASSSQRQLRHLGTNHEELQGQLGQPLQLDALGPLADNDDITFLVPAAELRSRAPKSVAVYVHDTQLESSAGVTRDVTDGETLDIVITDKDGVETAITHVFDSVTAGNATPAELAASFNADLAFTAFAQAGVAPDGTANTVGLMASDPDSSLKVTGGDAGAVAAMGFPTSAADNAARTLSSQAVTLAGGTGWTYTYAKATGLFTLTNETGATEGLVTALVQW